MARSSESESEESQASSSDLTNYESDTSESGADFDDENEAKIDQYDSSDEEDLRNTIGNIPVCWYDDYDHLGYNVDGRKLLKAGRSKSMSEIDDFLAKMDDPNYWRTVTDKQTGERVVLSDEALATLKNIQRGNYPKVGYNPYQPFLDLFSHETMIHPINNEADHKRSFTVSKSEAKKISKLVHAIKMGWLKPRKPKSEQDEVEKSYDLWKDESKDQDFSKSQLARLKMRIPAPKMKLPSHAESYNPPAEYLFTEQEREKWRNEEENERKLDFLPQKFDCMRHVPQYSNFIKERFLRCMDLYLAPRKRKMRLNVDAEDLLPKLPDPKDLRPFPAVLSLVYEGHSPSMCRCLTFEPKDGQYFASAGDDGCLKVWETHSGRCVKTIRLVNISDKQEGEENAHLNNIQSLAWCPDPNKTLIAAACGSNVYVINAGVGDRLKISETDLFIKKIASLIRNSSEPDTNDVCSWKMDSNLKICISHLKEVTQVTWHPAGDYFATVSPENGHKAVLVHQLTKVKSQVMFSKQKGIVQKVAFHPTRPYFFVANQRNIRVYNLIKQQLTKKLASNCRLISSIAVHPKGDNLIVGSYDCRLDWFDLDLSVKPYKSFSKHHKAAVRCVAFHNNYPLFASCSADGTVVVSHGMVYSDLMQNPLIAPLKILRTGRKNVDLRHCSFHPMQPWLLCCGSDGQIRLFT